MPYQLLLRLVLAIGFGALGNFLARANVPPNAPIPLPVWANLVVTLIFGAFGAVLPDIAGFLAKIGLARLAEAITSNLPTQVPFRRRRLKAKAKINHFQNPLILDTSAIIDGRLSQIVQTGFVNGTFLIIPSVLLELQHIADSQDDLKRARGRRGLEILAEIKKSKYVTFCSLDQDPEGKEVDQKLIAMAKKIKGKIITCDFNLAKVAQVKGVAVLNVNELAQAVRASVLPSEELKIKVIHQGKSKDQGVGYLLDGTMVVVENGGELIGEEVEVVVSRSLQTVAGRMIFVKVKNS
jgi:uncharacterized protein YacL